MPLTGMALTGDGGIEEIDPSTPDALPGVRPVRCPGAPTALRLRSPCIHTDAGDLPTGIALVGAVHHSFSPSAHRLSSASSRRPLSTRPSMILAPGALERSPAADCPSPLPPEVAKRMIVFPVKS